LDILLLVDVADELACDDAVFADLVLDELGILRVAEFAQCRLLDVGLAFEEDEFVLLEQAEDLHVLLRRDLFALGVQPHYFGFPVVAERQLVVEPFVAGVGGGELVAHGAAHDAELPRPGQNGCQHRHLQHAVVEGLLAGPAGRTRVCTLPAQRSCM